MRTIGIIIMTAFLHGGSWATAIAQENAIAESNRDYEKRTAWWREARYGMFIHWDMSSMAGTEISWSRGATKPLDITNDPAGYVEDPVYDNLYKTFNPVGFNADDWVALAKQAGACFWWMITCRQTELLFASCLRVGTFASPLDKPN